MSWTFFTDRDLGNLFPARLVAAGVNVERHCDLFPQDLRDEEWLRHVGENDRVAVTHNKRIRHQPNEKRAVAIHGVRLLVIIGKGRHADFAENFVRTLPKIMSFLDTHSPPFIAKIKRPEARIATGAGAVSGRIEMWCSGRELEPEASSAGTDDIAEQRAL